jgi:Flp pilus assembly protein TadB
VTTNSADVTGQTQDLDARITALRTTIQRMLELEARATDTSDLISLETAIGDRQGELESLEAQQRDLADQVAMSTIALTLHPKGTTVAPSKAGFGDGIVTGWSAFVAFWGTALVVLGVLLPWLVLAGLIVALVFGIRWAVRRRRRGSEPAQAVAESTSSSTASP